jgi:hypothetical protein
MLHFAVQRNGIFPNYAGFCEKQGFCAKKTRPRARLSKRIEYLCGIVYKNSSAMKNNEEYVMNKGRDTMIFLVSTVAMIGILVWKPEWVWVVWPFQFTALAGMLNRL